MSSPVRDGRIRAFRKITGHGGPAILDGSGGWRTGHVGLLAAAGITRRGHKVLLHVTWEPGSRGIDRLLGKTRPSGYDAEPEHLREVSAAVTRALDHPNMHYVVLSTEELTSFPETWGLDPARVHYVPFSAVQADEGVTPQTGGVFAGGDSLRDYRALALAASEIPAPVTVATRLPSPIGSAVPPDVYNELARNASVTIVPMLPGTSRSGGQQTYMLSMLQGKPTIVTEAPGVRDYIRHDETGLIVPNEPRALVEAVRYALRPEVARRLGAAAREDALRHYQLGMYPSRLLELAGGL